MGSGLLELQVLKVAPCIPGMMHYDRIGEHFIEEQIVTYCQDPDPFDVRRPTDVWMGKDGLCRSAEPFEQFQTVGRGAVPLDPV